MAPSASVLAVAALARAFWYRLVSVWMTRISGFMTRQSQQRSEQKTMKVSSHETMNISTTPASTLIRPMRHSLRACVVACCTRSVSAPRRETRSPDLCVSKKLISCVSRWSYNRRRSRETTRSPATPVAQPARKPKTLPATCRERARVKTRVTVSRVAPASSVLP
eukprot:scaffold70702_cov63-Phaeocystis_antarctica.AAC.4